MSLSPSWKGDGRTGKEVERQKLSSVLTHYIHITGHSTCIFKSWERPLRCKQLQKLESGVLEVLMPGSSRWHHGMRSCSPSTTWVLWSPSAPGSCRGRNGDLELLCDFSGRWRGSYASKSLPFCANWINDFICRPSTELWTEWGSLFARENNICCCPETLCQESNLQLCHFRCIWTSFEEGVVWFVCWLFWFFFQKEELLGQTGKSLFGIQSDIYLFFFFNSWIYEEFWWPQCNYTDWDRKKCFEMVTRFELSSVATYHETI